MEADDNIKSKLNIFNSERLSEMDNFDQLQILGGIAYILSIAIDYSLDGNKKKAW